MLIPLLYIIIFNQLLLNNKLLLYIIFIKNYKLKISYEIRIYLMLALLKSYKVNCINISKISFNSFLLIFGD